MASNVVMPEDVLEILMNDGTIDAIRLKIINQLKANEELKNYTITMVEQSKVLNTPGAEKQTKRELFDALRRELEIPVLEKASKSVWELILDNHGTGKEINEMVEGVFYRLSGLNPSSFSQPDGSCQQSQDNMEVIENGKIEAKCKQENSNDNDREDVMVGKERSGSLSKRSCTEMNLPGLGGGVNNESWDFPSRKRIHSDKSRQGPGGTSETR